MWEIGRSVSSGKLRIVGLAVIANIAMHTEEKNTINYPIAYRFLSNQA